MLGSSIGVLAVIGALVTVAVMSGPSNGKAVPRRDAPAALVAAVTGVPAATLDTVGIGTAAAVPSRLTDAPLTANGKPEVLYVGAEYCPYCAIERWPLVQALSRFGTFHGLKTSASAPDDVYPNTPTFSFFGASYTSDYLTFVGKEVATNERQGKGYRPLEKLTAAEQSLFATHARGTPFIYLGGTYMINGATYDATLLKGLTASQIGSRLADPANPVARGVIGAANGITAALCRLTGDRPSAVCATPAVRAYSKEIAR